MQREIRRISWVFVCILCMFTWSQEVQAQNVTDWINDEEQQLENDEVQVDSTQDETIKEPSFLWSLIKLIGILAIMIGFLYVAVRFFSKRNRQIRDLNILENLGGVPVGQQKTIQIIRLGSTYYLIGVGDNVELLQVINDKEIIQELEQLSEEPGDQNIFSGLPWNKQTKTDEHSSSSSFTQIYKKELSSIMNKRKNMIQSYQKREEENE